MGPIRYILILTLLLIILILKGVSTIDERPLILRDNYLIKAATDPIRGSQDSFVGMANLCMNPSFDGAAIIVDTSSSQEILAVFKSNSIWFNSIRDVSNFIVGKDKKQLFSGNNQMDLNLFPEIPQNPNYFISFSGLNRTNEFYNNLLVFKDNNLIRYRVDELVLDKANLSIKITLIGKHSTKVWHEFSERYHNSYIRILRGTRLLILERLNELKSSIYVLNGANLDNPIEYKVYHRQHAPFLQPFINKVKFYHDLETKQILTLQSTGQLCLNELCSQIREALDCGPQIDIFLNSFAYWAWQKLGLDYKALMKTLIWVMITNVLVALVFVYYLLRLVYDLT